MIDTIGKAVDAGSNLANAGANALNKKGQAQALSGGNTVQIPTIFFMVLAIFNN